VPIRKPSVGWRLLLRRLAAGGSTEDELSRMLIEVDGATAVFAFYSMIKRLHDSGMVQQTLVADGVALATLTPAGGTLGRPRARLMPQARYQLSRFAVVRAEGGQLLIESPLASSRVIVHAPLVAGLISSLARPYAPTEIADLHAELDPTIVSALLDLLLQASLLVPLSDDGTNPETQDPALGQWEFHDLLFHSRTRLGRHNQPYGGTMPGKDRFAPLPVVKSYPERPQIALPRPDIAALRTSDLSLTAALEGRRSQRIHGEQPLTIEQVGGFLYRTARVKAMFNDENGMQLSQRPYPAGGALYELEIYPVVHRCEGLASGLYHYQADQHTLSHLSDTTPALQQLLNETALTALMQHSPQLLLAITARFQRVQWKYRSVAYALILKHVGVLYQTMYLVATSMGLAGCGLGGGNADLFATAAGLDYYAETSVGEFILGTPPSPGHQGV
jgi:SagB-type dehydrogenase family enzyme